MSEFPQCCIDNVGKIPDGRLCSWDYCRTLQPSLNRYCYEHAERPCTPVPTIEHGELCYCCCYETAFYDTPVEAAAGEPVMVQDIVAGEDWILAGAYRAGEDAPSWQPRLVDYSSGISTGAGEAEPEFDYMYYLAYQREDDAQPPQFILTTADHLLLRPSGKVTPVQKLAPGDRLVNAHGGSSRVLFLVPACYKGSRHHIFFQGFDNGSLDDHLISTNGVVSADYAVQLAYATGELNSWLVDLTHDEPRDRSADSDAAKAARAFINDKTRWPRGMTPKATPSKGKKK